MRIAKVISSRTTCGRRAVGCVLVDDNYHIIATGYLWQLIGLTEIIAGLLLILNKWKGFALVIMAPISLNIVLYHLTYDIANFGPGALVAVLNVLLVYANWDKFKTLF